MTSNALPMPTTPSTSAATSVRRPVVRILGTHGVPAAYGGFETAAENVGLYLLEQGWDVIVYCQIPGSGPITTDSWRGLTRVRVPQNREGWLGTAAFDLDCIRHVKRVAGPDDICLTFGYNTGIFNVSQRLRGMANVINMDGMEWTRRRWGLARQAILLANERVAGLVGTLLIGDHPHISKYLSRHFGRRRVVTIAYGAHPVVNPPVQPVLDLGLEPGTYVTMICRLIPENSVLEIIQAWSQRDRGLQLVVLGSLEDDDSYHRQVRAAASHEVVFAGAIYTPEIVTALRYHALAYLHGHTVGGTNPSLVEAMAAGNPVIAHNNVFNRFVAGPDAAYFDGVADLVATLDSILTDPARLSDMRSASLTRFQENYTWEHIGELYEQALRRAGTLTRNRVRRHPKRGRSSEPDYDAHVRHPDGVNNDKTND